MATLKQIFTRQIKALLSRFGFALYRLPKVIGPQIQPGNVARRTPLDNPPGGFTSNLLHTEDPYQGFNYSDYSVDLHGWGSDSPTFETLITSLRPELIIEVGSWKGGSAIQMAELAKRLDLPTQIVCVDTWLGAVEFWTDRQDTTRYLSLGLKFGYPTVYYQFLANVCYRGFQKTITPFPQPSRQAAEWFQLMGIKAKLIYIDGSHDEPDVYADLQEYWLCLCEGGVIFGDDYSWEGVAKAVGRFCSEKGLTPRLADGNWIIEKGSAASSAEAKSA